MTISLTVFVILFFFIILGVPVAMCIGIAGIAGIYIFNINNRKSRFNSFTKIRIFNGKCTIITL